MKKSFLEKVYFGNIVPQERAFKKNKRLYHISLLSEEAYNKMKETIPFEYHDLIDKYVSITISYSSEAELDAFVYGVRYAFRLLLDALSDQFGDFEDEDDLE